MAITQGQQVVAVTAASETRSPAGSPWWPLATVLGVASLVVWRTGPGKIPGVEWFADVAAQWPLYPVLDVQAYVLRQALGQALYSGLGWAGTGRFLALHLAALLAAALLLGAWLLRRLGAERAPIAMCLLLISPACAVLLEWIGMYDAFSILIWVLLLVSLRGNPAVQAGVAVLGGLQNFEQFTFSVVLLALLPEAGRKLGVRAHPLALIGGAVAGKIALELYLRASGAVGGSRLSFIADGDMRSMVLSSFLAMAPVILFSALGSLWLPVLGEAGAAWTAAPRSLRWRGGAAAALVLGVGVIGADHTRVMVLVAFPLLVLLCMHLAQREATLAGWLRRPDTWFVLLLPPVVVWVDEVLPMGFDPTAWGL